MMLLLLAGAILALCYRPASRAERRRLTVVCVALLALTAALSLLRAFP